MVIIVIITVTLPVIYYNYLVYLNVNFNIEKIMINVECAHVVQFMQFLCTVNKPTTE